MSSIAFLKAAYIIAWVVYVGLPRQDPAAHAARGRRNRGNARPAVTNAGYAGQRRDLHCGIPATCAPQSVIMVLL